MCMYTMCFNLKYICEKIESFHIYRTQTAAFMCSFVCNTHKHQLVINGGAQRSVHNGSSE